MFSKRELARDFDGMPAGAGVTAAGAAGDTGPFPGALNNGARVDPAELGVPSIVYLVDSGEKEEDGETPIWLAFFKIDEIPEEFDGQDVLCYGTPSKHVFHVHKRITA